MKRILLLLWATIALGSGALAHSPSPSAPDGPYVLYDKNTGDVRTIEVTPKGELLQKQQTWNADHRFQVVSDKGGYSFEVMRHPIIRPSNKIAAYPQCMVLSDPHGDMVSFVSVLQANKVLDKSLDWSFGANHLIIIGDIFDRGRDVVPIFWLVYKLEEQARQAGGRVDFLLGNHEEMVLRGDLRYLHSKYNALSKALDLDHDKLWGEDSELGRWLRTRNLMMQVGDNLFVHAGISPEFAARNFSLTRTDSLTSVSLGHSRKNRVKHNPDAAYIFDSKGPFWYRGLVLRDKEYFPASKREVRKILDHYGVERIFVGHTIFEEVSTFYNKRVIAVNVQNEKNRKKGRSRGVLIKDGKLYTVYDSGELKPLK